MLGLGANRGRTGARFEEHPVSEEAPLKLLEADPAVLVLVQLPEESLHVLTRDKQGNLMLTV